MTKEISYRCDYCGQTFKNQPDCEAHEAGHARTSSQLKLIRFYNKNFDRVHFEDISKVDWDKVDYFVCGSPEAVSLAIFLAIADNSEFNMAELDIKPNEVIAFNYQTESWERLRDKVDMLDRMECKMLCGEI